MLEIDRKICLVFLGERLKNFGKNIFFAHYDYAENIYKELKNTDAECIWTDGCFDIFKDYQ